MTRQQIVGKSIKLMSLGSGTGYEAEAAASMAASPMQKWDIQPHELEIAAATKTVSPSLLIRKLNALRNHTNSVKRLCIFSHTSTIAHGMAAQIAQLEIQIDGLLEQAGRTALRCKREKCV